MSRYVVSWRKMLREACVLALVSLGSMFASAGAAYAVTVNCPGTTATNDREFSLTTSVGASCLAWGSGNVSGNDDAVNGLGYITLDKSDDSVSGVLSSSSALSINPPTSGHSGSFTISAPGYSSLVLALKTGEGQLNPDWAAFLLPANVFSGTWTIGGSQELSHAVLYGVVAAVPVPAGVVLLGSGLAGLGFLGWRRKRSTAAGAIAA